jgi:hypothetical protein
MMIYGYLKLCIWQVLRSTFFRYSIYVTHAFIYPPTNAPSGLSWSANNRDCRP